MYPKINGLIDELHSRGMSSFLVTNAQFPDAIRQLRPVTQLYVSVDAATKESLKVTIPESSSAAAADDDAAAAAAAVMANGKSGALFLMNSCTVCVVSSTPGGRPAPICRLLGAFQRMPLAPQGVQTAHRLPPHAGVRLEHERGEGPAGFVAGSVPAQCTRGNTTLTCAPSFVLLNCRWMHMLSCWTSGSRTSSKSRQDRHRGCCCPTLTWFSV